MDFLKNLSKQAIAAVVVGLIVFFAVPGLATLFFVGMAAGVVAGNFWPALEKLGEKAVAKLGGG